MATLVRQYPRRAVLGLIAGMTVGLATPVDAGTKPSLDVFRDPNCGCCIGWVVHLRRHGFIVHVTATAEMSAIKMRLGVPSTLASCHTAQLGGYVIEGHVPAHAIKRLLAENPVALGLAVPGMPIGSPGMEGGAPEPYDVILFGNRGQAHFGRYLGDRPA